MSKLNFIIVLCAFFLSIAWEAARAETAVDGAAARRMMKDAVSEFEDGNYDSARKEMIQGFQAWLLATESQPASKEDWAQTIADVMLLTINDRENGAALARDVIQAMRKTPAPDKSFSAYWHARATLAMMLMRSGSRDENRFYAEEAREALEKRGENGLLLANVANYQGKIAADLKKRERYYQETDALFQRMEKGGASSAITGAAKIAVLMERADGESDIQKRNHWLDLAEPIMARNGDRVPPLLLARFMALRGSTVDFVYIFVRQAAQTDNNPQNILDGVDSVLSKDDSTHAILQEPLAQAFIMGEYFFASSDAELRASYMEKAQQAALDKKQANNRLMLIVKLRLAVLEKDEDAFVEALQTIRGQCRSAKEAQNLIWPLKRYVARSEEEEAIWRNAEVRAIFGKAD